MKKIIEKYFHCFYNFLHNNFNEILYILKNKNISC